jgi:phage terminase small subunit
MSRDRTPTAKQTRFIAEYLTDLNASEAAIRAGYGRSSARYTASRLLQRPHIRAEVHRLQAEQLQKAGITAEGVLEQLRRIAYFDPATMYDQEGNLKTPQRLAVECSHSAIVLRQASFAVSRPASES